MNLKWDRRFLKLLTNEVAPWSKDPSTQVAAAIVRPDNTVASLGFNGFPRKMYDYPERYANREEKYNRVIHAELNAMDNARETLHGYTCYVTLIPCDRCAVSLINKGITRVVCPPLPADKAERWKSAMDRSLSYFKECNVEFNVVEF